MKKYIILLIVVVCLLSIIGGYLYLKRQTSSIRLDKNQAKENVIIKADHDRCLFDGEVAVVEIEKQKKNFSVATILIKEKTSDQKKQNLLLIIWFQTIIILTRCISVVCMLCVNLTMITNEAKHCQITAWKYGNINIMEREIN